MSKIRRRDVLTGAAALAACGGADVPRLIPATQVPQIAPRQVPRYFRNPTYQQPPIAPIHLSAAVQLQPGASSGVPAQALMNPMGQDMELLEVKFEISGASDLAVNERGVPFGGSIAADMTLGSYKVTMGSVPVWNFGRAENLGAETKVDSSQSTSYNAYSWRLPRPLFVPAGAVLAPTFNHLGITSGTLNVRVGYTARTVVKTPRVAYVPWVASYNSKVFNPITTAASDQSQPQQLVNDTGQVFHLQRFTGRTMFYAPSGRLTTDQPYALAARALTMRLVDSYGRPIVRTYTPFGSVFQQLTKSWELEEVGAELDPGGYYRVFLKKAAMTMGGDYETAQAQAFVSMVGWREEKV